MTTDIYRALSDPTRRRILTLLAYSPQTQSDIVKQFNISQPAITKHMKILREERLVTEQRIGRVCVYHLNHSVFEQAYHAMKTEIEHILDKKLESLKSYVESEETK